MQGTTARKKGREGEGAWVGGRAGERNRAIMAALLLLLLLLLLLAPGGSADSTINEQPWAPPALITVGSNATATELFAAASLESRLRDTFGLRAVHTRTASARTAGLGQLAVGWQACVVAGIDAKQLQGLGDDGYVLLPLDRGGVALGASRASERGALNAVYALLRAGGMRFLHVNVTEMISPRPALDSTALGHAVQPPFESRYDMSRAVLPCSADHCPSNFSAALGFNGPHAHAPAPGLWTQQVPLQNYKLPNGLLIGSDNSDIYDILAAGMLPLEPWVASCVNESR